MSVRRAHVHVFEMDHPEDWSGLVRLFDSGLLSPDAVRAVFVKTEGNGLDNDWSRPLALRALEPLLRRAPGSTCEAPMIVASGGCEGLLTPHAIVLADTRVSPLDADDDEAPSLAIGTAVSEPLDADRLGRAAHGSAARDAVERACLQAGLALDEVVHVHLLSPWMGRDLLDAAPADAQPVALDAHASKPAIRAAAAIGAGLAFGELDEADVRWTSVGPLASRHTTRVAVTAGDTGGRVHALVLGHSRRWRGPLRIASTQLAHMLDVAAIARVRRGVPLAAFYKGDPPAGARVRGARTTMASDSDIHPFRHFRAAMSGVFGATLGTARVFVGGGAECQCVPGGGVLTLIDDLTCDAPGSAA